MPNSVESTDLVFFKKIQASSRSIGLIELNRHRAINSLNLEMVTAIDAQLSEWQKDSDIAALFLYSRCEKGFCAGGDVKEVVLNYKSNPELSRKFFEVEYRMDQKLYDSSIPVICWGDGIVMGGGMGLFMASSHRIVTERSLFAMPEVAIGFFPDVGASFFLHQFPHKTGKLMALSGHRFKGLQFHALGQAHAYTQSDNLDRFIESLKSLTWSHDNAENKKLTEQLVKEIHSPTAEHFTQEFFSEVESIFSKSTLNECLEIWEKSDNTELQKALSSLKSGSFHSVQVIWKLLQKSEKWLRKDSTKRESLLADNFLLGKDFHEGVRALLIDKDKNPQWQSQQLTSDEVEVYFSAAI